MSRALLEEAIAGVGQQFVDQLDGVVFDREAAAYRRGIDAGDECLASVVESRDVFRALLQRYVSGEDVLSDAREALRAHRRANGADGPDGLGAS